MKFYSEKLDKLFNTTTELEEAELLANKQKEASAAQVNECMILFDAGITNLLAAFDLIEEHCDDMDDEDMDRLWGHIMSSMTKILAELV